MICLRYIYLLNTWPRSQCGQSRPTARINPYTILSLLNYEPWYSAAFGNITLKIRILNSYKHQMPQFKTLELCFPYSLTQHIEFVSKSFWLEVKLVPSNTGIWITTVIP